MFRHDRPHENLDKKIYRFALFGMSGSGKTGFLTAMGMICRPTTDGSCCSPLPAHRLASLEVQEGWATLQEDARRLSNVGELPKSTEVERGRYPRYRYVYSDSKVGITYFEIIDYSGELKHHSHIRHEDCTALLKHLTEHNVDGIIVIVSAPQEGQEQSDIPDEIAAISKTFNFLQSQLTAEHRYPIAWALTKWDRRWEREETIPINDADAEAGRLAQFMAQYTAYQTVRDILKGFSGSEGSFKVFPVSALGRCSNDEGKPDVVPLESYGLPFVFGWLVQAANDSDFRRFGVMQSKLSWWLVLPLVPCVLAKYIPAWAISAWKKWTQPVQETWSLGKSLLTRLPETKEGEEKRTAVKSTKKRLTTIWGIQLLLTVMVLCVVLSSIGVRVSDAWMLANAHTLINTSADALQDLENVEPRLKRVVHSSSYTVLFHGRSDARKQAAQNLLNHIYEKHEESALALFRSLEMERDNEQIQAEGQLFLNDYPNSLSRQEVIEKMAQSQALVDEAGSDELWERINNLTIEEQDQLQILGWQYLATYLTGKHRNEVFALINEVQRLHNESVALRDWFEFEKSVRAAIEEDDVPSAFSILENRDAKHAEWRALCEDILSKTTETVRRRIGNLGMQFDTIKNEIVRSQEAVQLLSNRGIAQADEVLRGLETLSSEIAEQEDKFHYDQVRHARTRPAVENYLANAPSQTMAQYVENYLQYLEQIEGDLNINVTATLSVGNKIFWGGGSSNEFRLFVNGSRRINIPDLNSLGFNSNETLVLRNNRFWINGKGTDTLNVRAEMLYNNWRSRDQGSGSTRFTIGDLRQSRRLTLTSKDDQNVRHTLTLRATGFPPEPPLPEWRPSDESSW